MGRGNALIWGSSPAPLRHSLPLRPCGFNRNKLLRILPITAVTVTSRFQYVSNFTDTWAQIGFFLNTFDPTFHKAPGQASLRALSELGASKHVLPSPQPTQTRAIEFQNSMILKGKDI